MSGACGIAPLLALVVSLAFRFALTKMRRYFGYAGASRMLPTLLALLVFPLACGGMFLALVTWTPEYGFGAASADANRALMFLRVPSDAMDVNYRNAMFEGTVDVVDFQISEDGFLNWMGSQDWEPRRFRTDDFGLPRFVPDDTAPITEGRHFDVDLSNAVTPVQSIVDGSLNGVTIRDGYFFHKTHKPPDQCTSVWYDVEKRRAYASRSTF